MLGISLFASAYGLQNIGYIAVIDLGHEIFIWFVFLALLMMTRDSAQSPGQLFQSFLKSPVILGILAGILLNVAGVGHLLTDWPIIGGIMAALEFLASMTVPLILIIVGYGIQLNREGFGKGICRGIVCAVDFATTLYRAAVHGPGFPFRSPVCE